MDKAPIQQNKKGKLYMRGFEISNEADIRALQKYNKALQNGLSSTEAIGKRFNKASQAAKELAKSSGGAGVNMDNLGIRLVGAKLKTVAMTAAQTALNAAMSMGLSVIVELVVSGLTMLVDNLIHADEKLLESKVSKGIHMEEEIKEVVNGLEKISDGGKKASTGLRLFSNIGGGLLDAGISIAIDLAVDAIDRFIRRDEIAIQKAQELRGSFEEFQAISFDNLDSLRNYETDFDMQLQGTREGVRRSGVQRGGFLWMIQN